METLSLNHILPKDFSPESKVWIYQSNRPFTEQEAKEIQEQLYQFYIQWQAHGKPVKGWAQLVYNRFIILMADESHVKVSGCSTDSSVKVIKSIERQYQVNMFDRLALVFLVKEQAETLPMNQLAYALENQFINADTLMFNNMVLTKKDLEEKWLVPLKETWLKDKLNLK